MTDGEMAAVPDGFEAVEVNQRGWVKFLRRSSDGQLFNRLKLPGNKIIEKEAAQWELKEYRMAQKGQVREVFGNMIWATGDEVEATKVPALSLRALHVAAVSWIAPIRVAATLGRCIHPFLTAASAGIPEGRARLFHGRI